MTVRLYEWDKTETGWAWIEITDNKVVNLKLRDENNLIKINEDDEAYVDLQLEDWIAPDDDFPVWVTTGRVLVADWRPVAWTVTVSKTTSGDQTMYLYGDDGKVYVDNGTGVWKILARPEFVTQDEYDALPNSKNTDNLLRIVVDNHLETPLSWAELEAMGSVDAKVYLDQHPLDYAKYYESTGDVEKIDYAAFHEVVLPSWKYVYRYMGQYVDEYAWIWQAYYFETNLTAQEVDDYFTGELTQETIDQIISWMWNFDFGK